jgi:Leucine-rich repeat (LRR) protein
MKMLFVISLLLLTSPAFAEIPDSVKVYHWSDVSDTLDRDAVEALSFHRMKLDSLPQSLEGFSQLKYLILRKNKLSELPDFIATMNHLVYIDLSQNRFKELPEEICKLTALEKLILNRNSLKTLPECISAASSITYIDLWDNPIRTLPESLVDLPHLKKVDLSGIKFAPKFQEEWYAKLPRVKWVFEEPCDCMN